MEILNLIRMMSFGLFTLSSAILLFFMVVYVRFILVEPYQHRWWLLSIASGAGFVYGTAGLLETYTGYGLYENFQHGAVLFFILFLALGIRAIARLEVNENLKTPTALTDYSFDITAVVLFVAAWWTSFVLSQPAWLVIINSVGWVVMLLFALHHAFRAVRLHEGTSLAAIVRDLLPAVISFGIVTIMEIIHQSTGGGANLTNATWIIGTILVSAFLFNTAITIRQEEAELHRIYDPSKWRDE